VALQVEIFSATASPEVVIADVRGLDAALVAEIADCHRRLDELAPAVVAVLQEIRQLEERAFDVADVIDPTWKRVIEVTGAGQLMDAAAQLVRAYPLS
jgi:hypothetical protein